ncbi:7169_t:CDS:2 [Paraglomus brasilianum]|uniref:7169_t:CDS:1 n=1 Tax=Paraglomus brasilianum TaxID=144538 RepID=A0A9N9CIZ1_9GLOM|nr:7169_t:CDS:2 [Paraglomus brasilianum]
MHVGVRAPQRYDLTKFALDQFNLPRMKDMLTSSRESTRRQAETVQGWDTGMTTGSWAIKSYSIIMYDYKWKYLCPAAMLTDDVHKITYMASISYGKTEGLLLKSFTLLLSFSAFRTLKDALRTFA